MSESREWIKELTSINSNEPFLKEIAQIKSKSLLKEVSEGVINYAWTYNEKHVLKYATALTFMLEDISITSPSSIKKVESQARQIALLWENLGNLGEKTDREMAYLNAAVAYELAGYQANALCLARQIQPSKEIGSRPSIKFMTSLFIQRLFLKLQIISREAKKEPETSENRSEIIRLLATAFAADGFENASQYFLSGSQEYIAKAMNALAKSSEIFESVGSIEEFNMLRSVKSLLPIMQMKSTWTILGNEAQGKELWSRYLRLLARGTGNYLLNSSSVSELWPSQIKAIERGLLSSSSSKIVSMPTNAGKTRVAELAIIHTLVMNPGSKCIYIAPYKSLVWELEHTFLNLLDDLGFKVSSVVGAYETDDLEELLISNADILVMTPEKLDLLQRSQSDFLDNVRLFVLDEGHIIDDADRGIKFELLMTRLRRRLAHARFLFISAMFPKDTLQDFARWLKSDNESIIHSDWRPSMQRFAQFSWKKTGNRGFIQYENIDSSDYNALLSEFIPGVISSKDYEFLNEETGRVNKREFPDKNSRSQTAAELAFKFCDLGPVLIFCSQKNFVESVAKSLQQRLNLADLTHNLIPVHFKAQRSRSLIVAEQWLGADHLITKLLRNGIAIHHGDIPEVIRKSIEIDFRARKFPILIATNTLAQGVNLPIRTVIVHTSRRRSYQNTNEIIDAKDYWNIAGRAGRAGEETEGTVIHLNLTRADEHDISYYKSQKVHPDPLNSALYKLLKDLIQQELPESELLEKLDTEILALLVEERSGDILFTTMEEFLNESLTKYQAERHHRDIFPLVRKFNDIAERIKSTVPQTEYWPIYSATGLSVSSCESIRSYISNYGDSLHLLLTGSDSANYERLIDIVLEIVPTLPEMQPHRDYPGEYKELLKNWINGHSVFSLANESDSKVIEVEEVVKFIEEFFSYLLPWGVSAFIKIAAFMAGIENKELSIYTRFLSTMIKFGVPNIVASWAMLIGIPFRDMAIKLGENYLSSNLLSDINDFNNFLKWLGNIDSETLSKDYGLRSPILEDVTRILTKASSNMLLRDSRELKKILLEGAWVRGTSIDKHRITALSARLEKPVLLIRDYDNVIDRNAIKVALDEKDIGFIDKHLAQLIAPYMDSGLKFKAKIVELEHHKNSTEIKLMIGVE